MELSLVNSPASASLAWHPTGMLGLWPLPSHNATDAPVPIPHLFQQGWIPWHVASSPSSLLLHILGEGEVSQAGFPLWNEAGQQASPSLGLPPLTLIWNMD